MEEIKLFVHKRLNPLRQFFSSGMFRPTAPVSRWPLHLTCVLCEKEGLPDGDWCSAFVGSTSNWSITLIITRSLLDAVA